MTDDARKVYVIAECRLEVAARMSNPTVNCFGVCEDAFSTYDDAMWSLKNTGWVQPTDPLVWASLGDVWRRPQDEPREEDADGPVEMLRYIYEVEVVW